MKVILAVLLWAAPAAAQVPSSLEVQLQAGFLAYLSQRPANPSAARCAAFLAERPELRFVIGEAGQDARIIAQWRPKDRGLVLARKVLDDAGLASSATLSPARLGAFFDRVAPTLVHELTHARIDYDLPYPVEGLFEHELLAYAEQAWYVSLDDASAKKELYEAGEAYLDKNMVRSGVRRRFGPLEVEQAAQWVLFSRDWEAFRAMVKTLVPGHLALFCTEAERLKLVARLRARRPQAEGEELAQLDRLLLVWADPPKLAEVRAYFNKELEAARARSGQGGPPP